jgi:hypothetical protein
MRGWKLHLHEWSERVTPWHLLVVGDNDGDNALQLIGCLHDLNSKATGSATHTHTHTHPAPHLARPIL